MAKLWNAMDAEYEIEDKVNAFMSTMFDELEQEYAYE